MTRHPESAGYRENVVTRRAADLLIIAMAVTAAAVCIAVVDGAGLPEFVFLTVLLWCGLTVARVAIQAGRRAAIERRRAQGLATTAIDEVARHAVAEERVRLAADIEAVVRASVTKMGEYAQSAENRWHADPTPALAAIQDEGRHAATELRRMLGLLREAEHADADPPAPSAAPRPGSGMEVLLGTAAVVLSVVERYPVTADVPAAMQTPVSLILTATAAGMLILRRRAPAVGAAACGGIFLTGALSGHPLSPGFWIILTPGWLAWTAMAGRTLAAVGGTAVLLIGIAVNLGWYNPVNLPICMMIVGGAAFGGALVGWSNRRRASAHQLVVRRSVELDTAVSDAVQGERVTVARDLHDVVSHAVAVMVMQAAAAETLRDGDPERARAALAVVRQTAGETLGELNRLVAAIGAGTMGAPLPAAGAVDHDADDLAALVHRMSRAGLRISLVLDGRLSGSCGAVVYRIVQEALTNAVRHAPGARVTVTVQVRADQTTVDVVDDGPGSADGSRRGYGLVGIAERVERVGGYLRTGPASPSTGFRVSARLPTTGPVPA